MRGASYWYWLPVASGIVLSQPSNSAINVTQPMVFSWQDAGFSNYQLQVATDDLFESLVVDEETTNTSFFVDTLLPSTTYYWRVRGI